MTAFYEVMIERNFSSAHQLRGYKGKCENLHGHNYKIEIYHNGFKIGEGVRSLKKGGLFG